MAESSHTANGAPARASGPGGADYDQWFALTPDPWAAIARLEHGGDRTLASNVESVILNAEQAQRPANEERLLKVLADPACTDAGRLFIARMLALVGSSKAVPALADLLGNPATADLARYAMDHIPDPAIDEAYREALGRLGGAAKLGLIGSIALRGDRSSVSVLDNVRRNAAEPAEVRAAAERAIARLSDTSAN